MRRPVVTLITHKLGTSRFFLYILPLFFIFFADAILSYTFPIIAERYLGSNTLLGVVMALSSVAGITCDLLFPSLFRGTRWTLQLFMGIVLALLFSLSIHISVFFLPLFFAILASVVWGIYYEMLVFAEQEMVVSEEERQNYTRSWGILYATTLFTSVVGPIIGAQLLLQPIGVHTSTILLLQSIALCLSVLLLWFFKRKNARHATESPDRKSSLQPLFEFLASIKHWRILWFAVLPAILMGITTEWIEATYWMLGGLFGQEINDGGSFSWAIVLLYSAPFMIGSAILARINIAVGKKYWSQIALLVGGLILSGVPLVRENIPALYSLIFISSFFFAFASPLNDAVYSDLIDRVKGNKLYLVGLAKANSSVAYIVSPIVMGIIADSTGYYVAFGFLGFIAVGVALILLLMTPRKLRLPQTEIKRMDM